VVAVAKPAKKASVKATPKEEPSEETAQDDDTKTEAQATESVTTTTPQDPPAETAEDAVAEPQVANDKKVQEESSQKNQPEEKAEAPLAASRAVNPATGSDPAASGGTSSANGSRSYTDLRQQPGNRPPAYPSDARREQRQGTVDLVYYVTPEGSVRDVHLVKSSGSADLDQSAMTAVEKYRYYPGQEGWTEHPVNFVLKGPAQAAPTRLRTSQNTAPTESTN
jgi:TonB family protein